MLNISCYRLTRLPDTLRSPVPTSYCLRQMPRGGILADDMGLGKTLQILAAIATSGVRKAGEGPTLIVCPVSVMHNWMSQMEKHTPSLSANIFHGSGRSSGDLDKNADGRCCCQICALAPPTHMPYRSHLLCVLSLSPSLSLSLSLSDVTLRMHTYTHT